MADRLTGLPVDPRFGLAVPWFVPHVNGVWEYRAMDPRRLVEALRRRLCWVCGQRMNGPTASFVVGPMCVVNRVSAEPPSHRDCAEAATRLCPFLSNPTKRRRLGGLPEHTDGPGIAIKRNPGVTAIYVSRTYSPVRVHNGVLMNMGHPIRVLWRTEGREATRDEVLASFTSGCPALRDMATEDGPEALAQYEQMLATAMTLVPAASMGGA